MFFQSFQNPCDEPRQVTPKSGISNETGCIFKFISTYLLIIPPFYITNPPLSITIK